MNQKRDKILSPESNFSSLTGLFVEHDLVLELLALLQGLVDAEDDTFAGLGSVEELTGAALLHDLCPGKSCELTEAIGAVDNRKAFGNLSVGQDEVAVCGKKMQKNCRVCGLV